MRRRGAVAAEAAVALPLLLAVMAGTIELTWYLDRATVVMQSAREGAIAGVFGSPDAAESLSICEARARASLTAAGFDGDGATVECSILTDAAVDALRAEVSTAYSPIFLITPMPDSLGGQAALLLQESGP